MRVANLRWVCLLILGSLFFLDCGGKRDVELEKEKEFQKKIKEAQELAEKIKKGDIFNEEAVIREKILNPVNVCSLASDFTTLDFGPRPEFRGDGDAVIYGDRSGSIHYYYFKDRRFYKIGINGRNPSFGMLQPNEADNKYIYERFKLNDGSWEGESTGILMNTEINWMNDPTLLTEIPAEEPYFVNQDTNIIYHVKDKYYSLDDKMTSAEITKEEYERLRDSRFVFDTKWKIYNTYKNLTGVWVTDLEEKNWNQLRGLSSVKSLKLIPSKNNIYVWGDEAAGICLIRPVDLNQYTVEFKNASGLGEGELLDIYEKEISPISQEIIGYKADQYKGTLRIVREAQGKFICEPQTKLHMQGIFAGDAVVVQRDTTILGRIL